jgi:hypothetical protein
MRRARKQATIDSHMTYEFAKWLRAARTWGLLFFLGFVSILVDSAKCQLSFGSVAVLQSADDYIVLAADSLRLSAKGRSLHSCKVDALDAQLVFADTGYGEYAGVRGKWDAVALARQHYHQLEKAPRHELIPALAEAYGADLAAKLKPDVTTHPEEGWPQVLQTALLAGFDEAHERVVIEVNVHQLRRDQGGVGYSTKRLPAGDAHYAEILGETSIAEELVAGRTLRSQSWRSGLNFQMQGLGVKEGLIAEAENIVKLTSKYEPSLVGGAVDTVLVSRKIGVAWIHRKQECAERFGH